MSSICPSINIALQNTTFTIPLYLLPIEGVDFVLGIDWLCTLGPITTDLSIPSTAFNHLNQHITLKATTPTTPTPTTYHQFCQLLSTKAMTSLHLLSIDTPSQSSLPLEIIIQTPSSLLYSLSFSIQSILLQHQTIFQIPRGSPPPHPHDHHIPLLFNTFPSMLNPIATLTKKNTIFILIQVMLHEGNIKPNTSDFSSPVLLIIKKKIWYMAFFHRL